MNLNRSIRFGFSNLFMFRFSYFVYAFTHDLNERISCRTFNDLSHRYVTTYAFRKRTDTINMSTMFYFPNTTCIWWWFWFTCHFKSEHMTIKYVALIDLSSWCFSCLMDHQQSKVFQIVGWCNMSMCWHIFMFSEFDWCGVFLWM